jgi:hypothetical protein
MKLPGFTAEAPLHAATVKFKTPVTLAGGSGRSIQPSGESVRGSGVVPAFLRRPNLGGCRCVRYINGHCIAICGPLEVAPPSGSSKVG